MNRTQSNTLIFLLSLFIVSWSFAQERQIDSVDVNYQNNQLEMFVRSLNNEEVVKRRQVIEYYNDSIIAYDIFWLECTAGWPATDYENHEITMDSVSAPMDIIIRLYYDTNIVNFDPNDGGECLYRDAFLLLDSLYLTVADQESLNTEEKEELVFEVYPNPANDLLEISGELAEIKEVRVYEASGKEVLRQPANAGNHLIVDVSPLENGVYILHCLGKGGIYNKQFVILSH